MAEIGKCLGRPGPSLEEYDLLERSIKKSKGDSIKDEAMDDEMREKEELEKNVEAASKEEVSALKATLTKETPNNKLGRKLVSYHDKLLHLNKDGNVPNDEEDNWMERQKREEEEEDVEEALEEEEEDTFCPTYKLPKSQHIEDYRK